MVGLNSFAVSKILSSYHVADGDQLVNLGLNLKFEAKQLKVIDYSRRTANGWEFSDLAIQLIQQYQRAFPLFFARLKQAVQNPNPTSLDFYPDSEAKARIAQMVTYLKLLDASHYNKVPIDADRMDKNTIGILETHTQGFELGKEEEGVPKRINGVPRAAILDPNFAEVRLQDQQFSLGDRVIYVLNTGKVPMSLKGVVVGIERNNLDVLFDASFISGTSLNGRCSAFRGMTVTRGSVLNITNPQYVAVSKAALAKNPDLAMRKVPSEVKLMPQTQQNSSFRVGNQVARPGPAVKSTNGHPIAQNFGSKRPLDYHAAIQPHRQENSRPSPLLENSLNIRLIQKESGVHIAPPPEMPTNHRESNSRNRGGGRGGRGRGQGVPHNNVSGEKLVHT